MTSPSTSRRELRRRAAGLLLAILALAAGGSGGAAAAAGPGSSASFIVICACSDAADRTRITDAVKRQGGRVFYVYREIPGFAVAAPRGTDARRFETILLGIPGVIGVQPDGVSHTNSSNGAFLD